LSKRLKAYRNSIGNPIFTEENCESLLGLDISDLIALTGIYGLIPDEEILDWNYSLRGSYPVCELGLYSRIKGPNGPDEIYMFFDAKKRTIYIGYIFLNSSRQGYGFKLFEALLEEAIKAGFSCIRLEAARGYHKGVKLVGYLMWCKFGFTMTPKSEKRFQEIINGKWTVSSILDLYEQQGGYEFWEEHGETWFGQFALSPGSINYEIFYAYKESKENHTR
jgi:hypothetical protein